MMIAQGSVLLRLILALGRFWRESWRGSALRRGMAALGRGASRQVRGSAVCRFLWRESAVSRAWPGSVACRLFTAILNIPCALVKWLYQVGRCVWDSSLFCRLLAFVGGGSAVLLGLLMTVMLAAPHDSWNNIYGLVGAAVVTAFVVIGSASRPQNRLELDRLGPYMIFYLIFLCAALAASVSTDLSMRFFFFHLTGFLLVLAAVSAVRRYEQLQLMVALAVLGVSVAALYGCYQGYIGVEINPSQQDMILNAGMPGRVYSFFDNPNNFAEQLVMLLPLNLALFLNSRWRGKLLSLLSLCLGVAAIGFTYSRSGWIGLALAVVVFLALTDWRFVPLVAVLGVAALPLLPETVYNRILSIGNTEDTSTSYRFAIYGATKNLMRDYWHRGVGLGNDVMKQVFQNYPTMFDGNYPIHTHNNYLQMWGETGVFGFISYLALLLYQLKSGIRAFVTTGDKRVRRMLAAAIGAFCGILVIGLAEYTWFYPRNMFTWWFLFGVIGACVKLTRLEKREAAKR